jgi:uncharacterized protein
MSHENTITFATSPMMLAAWPGLGNVGLIAVDYIRQRLNAEHFAELDMRPFWTPTSVPVKEGKLLSPRTPMGSFHHKHSPDILFFESNAQVGGREEILLVRNVLEAAKKYKASRIFTAAAIGTQMSHRDQSKLFYASNDESLGKLLQNRGVEPLREGEIAGPAGLLPNMAAAESIGAACILATVPSYVGTVAYPKALLEIVKLLSAVGGFEIDLSEAEAVVERMDQMFEQIEQQLRQHFPNAFPDEQDLPLLPGVDSADEDDDEAEHEEIPRHVLDGIEQLFAEAAHDRHKAIELKQELDRWGLFNEYEDRFLDLFQDDQNGKEIG